MKIHNRLALLLLTAGLAGCGSDLGGGSQGDPLPSTGVVITPAPITSPTAANKASVGFRVIFPEQAEAQKAALNPVMSKVNIYTDGACGEATLELTPTVTSGIMNLLPGDCYFFATATDSFNTKIETAKAHGTLLTGANDVYLTFLGGSWYFVDPTNNTKAPLIIGGETLSGITLTPGNNDTLALRWLAPNGTGGNVLKGVALTNIPSLYAAATFSGGTGVGSNLMTVNGGRSNLENWEGNYTAGQRIIKILGVEPTPVTFIPETYYTTYHTSKLIDGTTIEGYIGEVTVDSITPVGEPSGTCGTAGASKAGDAALTKAINTVRKSAAETFAGTLTTNWTACVNGQNQAMTATYSNITLHPFRAKSVFADPNSALKFELNTGLSNYQKALASEYTSAGKGIDLTLLRKAASNFIAATQLAGDTLSPDADTARFFGAISRLASLAVDTTSDGAAGLNDFNDVLDALGVPADATSRNWSNMMLFPENCDTLPPYDCRPNLPANSPTSGELLTLLDSKLNTQLDLAIADLAKISRSFTYDSVDPSGAPTNFDYGDALALTAIAHGIKAELAIDMAYDLNLDIDATFNGLGPVNAEAFLAANPNIGKLDTSRYVAELTQAKADLQTALTTMQLAIDEIAAEGTGVEQETEFISFYTTDNECIPNGMGCTWTDVNRTDQELLKARDTITQVLAGLNGPITVDNRNTFTTSDDVIIDPSKFFAGISFRDMLPGFTGDTPNGIFANPTMNDLLVQGVNINEDLDGNGVTDLLLKPGFYQELISDNTFSGYTWLTTGGNISWTTEFVSNVDGSKTVTANWNYWTNVYPYTSQTGTATGEWSILPDGSLQINFAADTAPSTITGMNLTLEDIDQLSQSFDAKVTLTFADASTMTNWSWWQNMMPPAATGDATIK